MTKPPKFTSEQISANLSDPRVLVRQGAANVVRPEAYSLMPNA